MKQLLSHFKRTKILRMKFINFVLGLLLLFIVLVSYKSYAGKIDPIDTYSNKYILASRDTIKPRYDDFVNDSIRNPFDLQDPSVIEKTIEYDPETGLSMTVK